MTSQTIQDSQLIWTDSGTALEIQSLYSFQLMTEEVLTPCSSSEVLLQTNLWIHVLYKLMFIEVRHFKGRIRVNFWNVFENGLGINAWCTAYRIWHCRMVYLTQRVGTFLKLVLLLHFENNLSVTEEVKRKINCGKFSLGFRLVSKIYLKRSSVLMRPQFLLEGQLVFISSSKINQHVGALKCW